MAVATPVKKWSLRELHRLPDDGNKYELVRGELFVTPPPTDEHENIAARLTEILGPYVRAHGLGHVYHPRAVMRYQDSEVEPDLMVRQEHPRRTGRDVDWSRAPIPILVVEIASGYTRRRDRGDKMRLYMDAGVDEYWIVDPESRDITVIHRGRSDAVQHDRLTWSPAGAAESLAFEVAALF